MAGVRCTDVQTRPTPGLAWTSVTRDALQALAPPCAPACHARPGADGGAAGGPADAAPPPAPERAWQESGQAWSQRPGPAPSVAGGWPCCRAGHLLGPAHLPCSPHALVADDLLGINSNP